jgi:hypothetical protein
VLDAALIAKRTELAIRARPPPHRTCAPNDIRRPRPCAPERHFRVRACELSGQSVRGRFTAAIGSSVGRPTGCLQISWAATGADVQNDFSGNVFMQSRHVRGRAFYERKDCAHDGGELVVVDEVGHGCEVVSVGFDNEYDAVCVMFFGELGRGLRDNRNQRAARFEHLPRPPLDIAAGGVEHDVDLGDGVLEAPGLVVDDPVRAELFDELFIEGRRHPDHRGARMTPELHRVASDPAGCALHQQSLMLLEPGVFEQPLPCRERGQRKCGRMDVID